MQTHNFRTAGSVYAFDLDMTGAAGSSGVFAALQNTTGKDLYIVGFGLNITTQSTGASTLDIGYTATSATTSSDTMIDGLSGATAGHFGSSGTNGKPCSNWASGKWITVAEASGDVTALVGRLHIIAKEL